MKIKEASGEPAIDIAFDTIAQNKQALVFCNTRMSSEATAEKISHLIKSINPELEFIADKILKALSSPTKQCRRLATCVKKGIAFHHAGLASEQRKLVEDGFRKGIIKVICCTPTLCLAEKTKIWHDMEEIDVQRFSSKNSLLVLSNTKVVSMKAQKIEKNFNERDLVKITSVSGYSIILTPNHEILVKRNRIKEIKVAADCRKSDKIATIAKIKIAKEYTPSFRDFVIKNSIPFQNTSLSENHFYLIGAMLGDGYSGAEKKNNKIAYKGSPAIVGEDKEIFESIITVLKKDNLHYNLTKNHYGTPSLVLTKANWFREFLCNCGVEKGTDKHIDQKLMYAELNSIKSILQGLYDTDGYVQKGTKAIGFANTSIRLIKNVQKLLLRFEIVTVIREKKPSTMKIYSKEYPTRKSYELLIMNKRCLKIFQNKINFKVLRKKEALQKILIKIESNINYVECFKCNYKLYSDLFSGRTKEQKVWGQKRLNVIKALGEFKSLKSRELTNRLGFLPRHEKGNRHNHHYYLISKKKYGNREWVWSLNSIGTYMYKHILGSDNNIVELLNLECCPICKTKLNKILKKGWRDSDFEDDIFWDKIKNIERIPKKESRNVYDVVLSNDRKNDHFFVAEGFLVHNSFGMNLPAFRSIIKDLKRYGGRWGMEWIPTLEYHQMAGRAGRPDFNDKHGEAICIATSEKDIESILEKFINAPPEDIYSKLAVEPVLRTYCLSLLATGFAKSQAELIAFFQKTFYGHQYGDMEKIGAIIDKILSYLDEWEFIDILEGKASSDFVSANEIGTGRIEVTKLGERVAQLYLDPYTAFQIMTALRRATAKEPVEFSFVQMATSCLELRPLPTVRVKEAPEMEEAVAEHSSALITFEPGLFEPEYNDFLKSIKLAVALNSWMDEKNEDEILETFNIAPGELHVKKGLCDWILYASAEICHLMNLPSLLKIIQKTRFRLSKGVKEELIPLIRIPHVGRVRARKLFRNGIKDAGDLKSADITKLTQLVGPKTASLLKKEMGDETEKVPDGKRKGQLGLGKY